MERIARLDIDSQELPPELYQHIAWVLFQLDNAATLLELRKTVRGWHVIVTLARPIEPLVLVALQAILGSDPRRETFNLVRAQNLALAPECFASGSGWNTLYSEKL